jgi:hypothetical protein
VDLTASGEQRGPGAIALIISLFLPWYGLELPSGLSRAIDTQTQGLPEGLRDLGRSIFDKLA